MIPVRGSDLRAQATGAGMGLVCPNFTLPMALQDRGWVCWIGKS